MEIKRYTEPGMTGAIRGEPNEVYHSNTSISNSNLSLFLKDPKRFEAERKGFIERKSSAAFTLGSLFHTLSLESVEVYQSQYVIDSLVPQKPTKAQIEAHAKFENIEKPTKAQLAAFEKQHQLISAWELFWRVHEGKEVVSSEDDQKARAMRDAMFADPDAMQLLGGEDWRERKETELALRTETTGQGFSVQVKLDILDILTREAIDLKSVRNLDQFRRNFADFGYYRQAAFYCLVCELVLGFRPEFYFIAVESEAPHEVAVFQPDASAISLGIDEIQKGLGLLGRSIKADHFPKRFNGLQTLELRPWEFERAANRIADMESQLSWEGA